jgi:predicted PurR-regulated permease PerM
VILSTVPMVILSLTQHSVGGALLVIAWISVIHAIEAYLLNPNILGHSASMNPIIVVFALLAGKQFGGLTGALLAVPIASVIVSLFGYYRRLVAESYATETGGAVPVDDWDD